MGSIPKPDVWGMNAAQCRLEAPFNCKGREKVLSGSPPFMGNIGVELKPVDHPLTSEACAPLAGTP